MPVLHFSSDSVLLQKEFLKKNAVKRLHTIATQINMGHFWPNCDVKLFPTPTLKLRCIVGKLHSGL